MVAERGTPLPQKQTSEKICEQIVDVHVPQIVGQVLEVPKTACRDRSLECTAEQILDVLVPEMAKQLVEVPETISPDRIQQRTVEQIVDASVPHAVEELAEVFRVFSQDRIQQRTVGQTIPATSLAEMIVEVLVIQMQGRTQQGVNTHVQHVVNAVEVEKSEIIEETVQRMKHIIQEKINQVIRHVETLLLQIVEKTFEIPELQFTDKVVDNPVVAQRQISMETVQKIIETPQLQYCDDAIDVPVVSVVEVPRVWVVKKTVEDPQFETVENPETQISDVVIDACLTCDAKCKVACETCVKGNMFMVTGEMTVAGKMDDLNGADSKCEVLFHVNKQSLDFASGVDVDTADFDVDEDGQNIMSVVAPRAAAQHRSIQSPQQRNHDKPEQQIEQAMQERERRQREEGEKGREREKGRKGEGEKKGKERAAEEEGEEEVKKDVTDWVEVRRIRDQKEESQDGPDIRQGG